VRVLKSERGRAKGEDGKDSAGTGEARKLGGEGKGKRNDQNAIDKRALSDHARGGYRDKARPESTKKEKQKAARKKEPVGSQEASEVCRLKGVS